MGRGPTRVPLFILYSCPTTRECWAGGNLRFSPSDAVPSLAGFIHQEEEEVIPQSALACRRGWAGIQGIQVEKEKEAQH